MWRSLLIPVKVILVEEKEKELDWIVFKREWKEKQMAGGEALLRQCSAKDIIYLVFLFICFVIPKLWLKLKAAAR